MNSSLRHSAMTRLAPIDWDCEMGSGAPGTRALTVGLLIYLWEAYHHTLCRATVYIFWLPTVAITNKRKL